MPSAMTQTIVSTTAKQSADLPLITESSSDIKDEQSNDDAKNGNHVEYTGPVRYIMEFVDNSGVRLDVKLDTQPIKLDSKASPTVLEIIETRTAPAAPRLRRTSTGVPDKVFGSTDQSSLSSLNVKSCRIRILSSKLINALRSVVKYYPGQSLLGDKLEFPEPYQFLVHHRHELELYKTHHPPQHDEHYRAECNEHIDHLLQFLNATMGKELDEEEQRHKRGFATFEYLWLLLKPGDDFFINDIRDDRIQSGVLERVDGGVQDGETKEYFCYLWKVTYTGDRLYRLYHSFYLQPFDGEREIKTLWIYPTSFHKDTPEDMDRFGGNTLAEQMVLWGEKYWNLSKKARGCLRDYQGKVYGTQNDRIVDGKVMVDFEAYQSEKGARFIVASSDSESDSDSDSGPATRRSRSKNRRPRRRRLELQRPSVGKGWGCECEHCNGKDSTSHSITFYNYDSVDPKGEPPNRDHYFFLCNRDVLAFALRDREFVILDIEHVQKPKFDTTSFQYLVLDGNIKRTIQNLAWNNYQKKKKSDKKQFSADFIKGKGEGQVFLLHGPPGVGKTCTAECVAEMTRRPLLSLTSGDLGTTARNLEVRLDKYLRLGERWGAIVLIDEADVYLERREKTDIKRNSLVSVLLRALEYYQGILFLTTNRIGVFDEAFISRIHVPLYFKALTNEDRQEIWRNNFARLKEETGIEVPGPVVTYATNDPAILALNWNGREIRNAFQTAVALAESTPRGEDEKAMLTKGNLQEVVTLAAKFHDYIEKLNKGQSQATLAGIHRYREPESEISQPGGAPKSPILISAWNRGPDGLGLVTTEEKR